MRKIPVFIILFILLFCNTSSAYIPDIHVRLNDVLMLNSYIENRNYGLDTNMTMKVARTIISKSHKHGVPWEVIAAIAQNESDFDNSKIGGLGEIGIMQILTLECNGEKFDKKKLKEISYNIECGVKLFKEKVRLCGGDIITGIMYYNGKGKEARKYLLKISLTLIYMLEYRIKYFKDGVKNESRKQY